MVFTASGNAVALLKVKLWMHRSLATNKGKLVPIHPVIQEAFSPAR